MIRLAVLLSMGLLLAAAGPANTELPEPPLPPPHPPSSQAAPVPDTDARAPLAIASDDPRITLEMYRVQRYDASRGFAPGSKYESSEDRKAIQTPGLAVRVPLP